MHGYVSFPAAVGRGRGHGKPIEQSGVQREALPGLGHGKPLKDARPELRPEPARDSHETRTPAFDADRTPQTPVATGSLSSGTSLLAVRLAPSTQPALHLDPVSPSSAHHKLGLIRAKAASAAAKPYGFSFPTRRPKRPTWRRSTST
jgi:hypothetical protein